MQTCTEPMDASKQFCPNEACSARGQKEQGNISIHDRKRQRYRCKACKHTFSARRGTMLEGLRKPMDLIVIVVTLLTYGCPVQAIVHAFELDERTVADWRDRAGAHCQKVHKELVDQGDPEKAGRRDHEKDDPRPVDPSREAASALAWWHSPQHGFYRALERNLPGTAGQLDAQIPPCCPSPPSP